MRLEQLPIHLFLFLYSFSLWDILVEKAKNVSEPDGMPYAKVQKDWTSSMPVLQDETRRSLTWLTKAEGRRGANYRTELCSSTHKRQVPHTLRTTAHLTRASVSVGWLDCFWAKRMFSTAFQPGSARALTSSSVPPFSLVSLPSVIFTQGHQSLCWEVGSKKLREDVSWWRRRTVLMKHNAT